MQRSFGPAPEPDPSAKAGHPASGLSSTPAAPSPQPRHWPPVGLAWLVALAGGRAEAATVAHALPEAFALLGGHGLPSLGPAAAEPGAMATAASKSAKE